MELIFSHHRVRPENYFTFLKISKLIFLRYNYKIEIYILRCVCVCGNFRPATLQQKKLKYNVATTLLKHCNILRFLLWGILLFKFSDHVRFSKSFVRRGNTHVILTSCSWKNVLMKHILLFLASRAFTMSRIPARIFRSYFR